MSNSIQESVIISTSHINDIYLRKVFSNIYRANFFPARNVKFSTRIAQLNVRSLILVIYFLLAIAMLGCFFGLKWDQSFWTGRYIVIWTAIGMISSTPMDIILSGPMDINVPTCLHKHQSMTLRRQFAPLFLFFFGIFVVLLLPVFLGILLLGILLLLLLLLLTISRFRVLQRRGAAWTCIKT